VPDVPDPLVILEKLLGQKGKQDSRAKNGINPSGIGEVDIEEELDFEGLSLREFASRKLPYETESDGGYVPQTIEECRSATFIHEE
jgi:hypothetical protein